MVECSVNEYNVDYAAIYNAVEKISKTSNEVEIKNIVYGLGSIERKKLKEIVGRVSKLRYISN